MLKDYTVSFTAKDADTGELVNHHVRLETYCREVKTVLMTILNDIEQAYVSFESTPNRNLWSKKDYEDFMKIRRNLLNSANNVERLPGNLYFRGKPAQGMPIADLINMSAQKLIEDNNLKSE
jgi:hypothetical protein